MDGFQSVLRAIPARAVSAWRSGVIFLIAEGMTAGSLLLAWCSQWAAFWGTGLPAISALMIAIATSWSLSQRLPLPTFPVLAVRGKVWTRLGLLLLCTLFVPSILNWEAGIFAKFEPAKLAFPGFTLALLLIPAMTLIAPCVFFVFASSEKSPAAPNSAFLFGCGFGILISAFGFAPLWGATWSAVLLVIVAMVLVAFSQPDFEIPPTSVTPSPTEENVSTAYNWVAPILVTVVGGSVAWGTRVVSQLMPLSLPMLAAVWAGVCLGFVGGTAISRRFRPPAVSLIGGFALGCWILGFAGLFPAWMHLSLSLAAQVSSVFLHTLCRCGIVLAFFVPVGLAWGIFSVSRSPTTRSFQAWPAAFLTGWCVLSWALIPGGSLSSLAILLAVSAWLATGTQVFGTVGLPNKWSLRFGLATVAMMMASLLWLPNNYRPDDSARLLFSSPVFAAFRSDLDSDLLTSIGDGRLLAQREGQQSTLSLWKHRGVQFQVRENGLPAGMASGHSRMCPEFSAEVLPALLPLTLHDAADSVLVLGLGSGVPVETALAFPTLDVTCLEPEPTQIEMVKNQVWQESPDDRLTILPMDPGLALRSRLKPFDVIISNPSQPSLAESASALTAEFYQSAAAKLNPDGIFCQRFTTVDFGPEALQTLAATWRTVFQDVVFVEMAAGEMLLLGTNSPQGVARAGFMERLQRGHVRRLLAGIGWDWSIPLNLTALNHESLQKFAQTENREPARNSALHAALAFRLPGEMMRWGPKPNEMQAALAPHAGRFAQWGGIDPEDPDLLRRLAEVTGQRKLMAGHPDEYWGYRKTVKDQITKRPRAIIVQVKGEAPTQKLHPEDQTRLAYFRALGDVVKHSPHRLAEINRVAMFAEPYDPLMTFFLHQEVAELYSRAEPRNPAKELMHRFHSIYFAAPQDRSVRNIIAALELLVEYPEAVASSADRWDHLNALLQMMKQRWAVRAGVTPDSTDIALNDVDKSLQASNAAIKTMDTLANLPELETEDWPSRKQFLETTVVRPLRAYRRQLLPFQKRERVMKTKKQLANDEA